MKKNKVFAGYIFLKNINGILYPSYIQNKINKEYIENNLKGKIYMSQNENMYSKNPIVLNSLITENNKINGIVMLSVFYLPKQKKERLKIYKSLIKNKKFIYLILKNLIFFKKEDLKKIEDIKSLNYIFKKFENAIYLEKKLKNKKIRFNKLHKHINKLSLNNLRLSLIKKINQDHKFSNNYYNIAKNTLDFLIGNEVAMQKNINVSIQTPRDKDSMLSMHSDIHAGESPFEVVAWLPLTDVVSNSMSMFITKPKFNRVINKAVTSSKKNIEEIYKKNKKKFKFIKIKFGEILIFSPILLHGNTINETDTTRVSMNCRFKSLLSPYNVFSTTHRNIPHFFKPLTIKPMTRIGFNFIRKINEKK